jgi:hypothetical protein
LSEFICAPLIASRHALSPAPRERYIHSGPRMGVRWHLSRPLNLV